MLTARCLCETVRFEITGKLGAVVYCHCSECRRASGTAFAANADLRTKYVRWISGRDAITEYERSPGRFRAFCARCGSPIYSRVAGDDAVIRVRLGSLDGDPSRRSLAHCWVSSKAPWFEITDGLPRFEEGPPPPSPREGAIRDGPEPLDWRHATSDDADLLAELNARLIRDEESRNPMTVPELADRMCGWLRSGEYQAILFSRGSQPAAYALYRKEAAGIHLRQLFVERSQRRRGIGRVALEILRSGVWPPGARVRVEVLATNPEGAAFWRGVGFRDYASTLELIPGEKA